MLDLIKISLIAVILTACGTVVSPPPGPDAGDMIDADASIEDEPDAAAEVDAAVSEPDAAPTQTQMVVELSGAERTAVMYAIPVYYSGIEELGLHCEPNEVLSSQFIVPEFSIPPDMRIERITFTCKASTNGKCSFSVYDSNNQIIGGATENNLTGTWASPLTLTDDSPRETTATSFYMYGFIECSFGSTMAGGVTLYLGPAQ